MAFVIDDIIIQILIAVAVTAAAYLIMPKPKGPKTDTVKDLENPVAEANKPMPKVWGTMIVKGLNVLWFGDKNVREFEVKVGSKK